MGKYVLNATKTGYTFHLKAGNGETILTSEVYSTKDACENGIESVRKNAPAANIEDQTIAGYEEQKHPKFVIYEDKGGKRGSVLSRATDRISAHPKHTIPSRAARTVLIPSCAMRILLSLSRRHDVNAALPRTDGSEAIPRVF